MLPFHKGSQTENCDNLCTFQSEFTRRICFNSLYAKKKTKTKPKQPTLNHQNKNPNHQTLKKTPNKPIRRTQITPMFVGQNAANYLVYIMRNRVWQYRNKKHTLIKTASIILQTIVAMIGEVLGLA